MITPANGATHALEALELAQALDVGVGGGEVGVGLRDAAAPLVELLLRDGVAACAALPSAPAVLRASARLAAVCWRAAIACDSCWSTSGVSISASSSPFLTWLPMSFVQRCR